MENADSKPITSGSLQDRDSSQSVRVAVNIRPLITPELANGCTDCITVVPGEPQVQIGSHTFTYDYVYGSKGSPSSKIFDDCAAPLVDALFNGYNATVLAYGQTGSGKTYTMGTNYHGDDNSNGVIPRVVESIFKRVEMMKSSSEFLIRVSFIEIFKEEVFDLLDSNSSVCKGDGQTSSRTGGGGVRAPIQIRETANGGITLAGVTEAEVKNKDEMACFLLKGSVARATGSTNMNSQSSRSHAIFTISVEQKKGDEVGDDILSSKLHLVDLAGSERAKRTGADGMRLKEGIHINKGLLALGNVISALGDDRKRKEGAHVPYRDSKLTRLLQDSLGGNSKTVMIACVSPADTNAEETLNTLKYANRARNIQNKAIINRDPVTDQLQKMRSQIEQLQSELLFYKGDISAPYEELQMLKYKVSLLEASNTELQRELQERQVSCEQLMQRAIDAQVEKDKLIMQIESVRNGNSWDEIDEKDCDLLKSYVSKIQELEGELLRLQNMSKKKQPVLDWTDSDDDGLNGKTGSVSCLNDLAFSSGLKALDLADDGGVKLKELEHSSLQEKLDKELKELDQKLEEKEAEMKRVGTSECSLLRQHYEKKISEMDLQKRTLLKEIDELRSNLSDISSTSDDGAQKLKQEYLQKLNLLEAQVAELKKKQETQSQLLRQKQKSDDAAKRLQDEIHRIKSQKVQLQHKIKQESESFRLWKAAREKEVLQLRKEGRRNEYEMHKLLALNQRQKMVLQRKTEEASMATKRLKEVLESRKTASRENGSSLSVQALMQAIEHELEVTVRVHEVRSEYERQMEERAKMAKEIARLKEELSMQTQRIMIDHPPQGMSPGARNSRIFALENMLGTSSSTLVSMASQLSEAEERERSFSGRGRWNQVRSLAEAKNLMNYLFNIASSSRCQLRDKEVDCREKDSEIRDLKQKIVQLNSALRQSEMHRAELAQQQNMLGARKYPLRKQENRNSIYVFEDMDLAGSESDSEFIEDDDDDEWVQSAKPSRKRVSRAGGSRSSMGPRQFESSEKTCAKEGQGGDGTDNSGLCCSCSKSSRCKTNKCECRHAGTSCGGNCGCLASLCSNRESDSAKDEASDDVKVQNSELAIRGLSLLQSAFGNATPSGENNDDGGSKRKALSDIGNKAKPNIPKPIQRKKWGGKQVLQLVPQTPTTAQPETPAPAVKNTEETTIQGDVPLRLPRAMRTPAASGTTHLLRDRNSEASSDSSSISKDSGPQDPKSRAAMPGNKENDAC